MAAQLGLFGETTPPGLRYGEDVVTAVQEAALVERFADLPFKPFEFHGYLGNRRVVSFGWRYDYARRAVGAAEAIPDFLLGLREQAAAFAQRPAESFQQAMVSEYAPGAGIGWHRDKAEFAEVIGVSLLAPCVMRFRRKVGAKWERAQAALAPRSAYLLTGEVRTEWQHSITPMATLRYSVTFRSLAI